MKRQRHDVCVGFVSQNTGSRVGLAPTRFKGQYLLLEGALLETTSQNIGVLLLAADSGRLHHRFRRDFEKFAGEEADWFNALPAHISQMANELGARKCIDWLESTLSNAVRISSQKCVVIEHTAHRTLNELYAKHIRPTVLPFRTHLPQYSLEAAAGKFGKQMAVDPEGWIEVQTDLPLTDDVFVVHVEGHSMEPQIPDGSLCAFRNKIAGSWEGKTLLLEQYGVSGGNSYTVKLCRVSPNIDPHREGDKAWLHPRMTLQSINPRYESWDVPSEGMVRCLGEFLFVCD